MRDGDGEILEIVQACATHHDLAGTGMLNQRTGAGCALNKRGTTSLTAEAARFVIIRTNLKRE
jgi:hypothetical protein